MTDAALARLGEQLRRAGLTPRALAAWAGLDHLPALATRLDAASGQPIAARALAAFVGGHGVDLRAALGDAVDALIAAELVEPDGRRARMALLPVGRALLICDRADDPGTDADALCWPDDSSYHLVRALPPGRHACDRWLDLGTGSGFAPLARPELARAIAGTDVNPRAVSAAARGAALSGITQLATFASDLADAVPAAWRACDLVTFNAPIPADPGDADAARWRRAPAEVLARAWPAIAGCLAPDGLAVVHCALAAIPSSLAGEAVTVCYTPADFPRAFGVTWWRPSAPARRVLARRELTAPRPHLDWDDRAAASAGALISMC